MDTDDLSDEECKLVDSAILLLDKHIKTGCFDLNEDEIDILNSVLNIGIDKMMK